MQTHKPRLCISLLLVWLLLISKDDLHEVIDRSMAILGYTACKPEQKDARSFLYIKDVFVSVPTGYGKSAIFKMLPTCAEILLSTIEGHKVLLLCTN